MQEHETTFKFEIMSDFEHTVESNSPVSNKEHCEVKDQMTLDSFKFIAKIGQGSFGEVFLVRKKDFPVS